MSNANQLAILIADDDPTNREILTDALQHILPDIDITYASNGEQATDESKAQIEATNQNFDLIFMDYQMPLMNGQEATKAIRDFEVECDLDATQSAYIITWSAARHTPFEGADDAMSKPLQETELKFLLENYI
jgi:CheY-like chemotaxis protein